jgi:hypothetical protein
MKKHFIRLLTGATILTVFIFVVMLCIRFPSIFVAMWLTAVAYFIGMIFTMEKT